MAAHDIGKMISILQCCKDIKELGGISPKLKHHIDDILEACDPMLRQVQTLLRAQQRMNRLFELQAAIREEYNRCLREEEIAFNGEMVFLTEQPILEQGRFAGPLLRADTQKEAESRAALLGLKLADAGRATDGAQ